MTARISFCLLLFLTGGRDCALPGTISPPLLRYCHICADHTMCRYPDDVPGVRCAKLEHDDLQEKDIETILYSHNFYRNTVANGDERRGNPGPQPPAKYMMEMIWDDELARIADRWALQCNLLEKDQCRDVERFGVWQNVHVLDMASVGNLSSVARLHVHIQSWYDEVEGFDTSEIGYLNFTARSNLSYVAFASATISQVGCGRAIYTRRDEPTNRKDLHTIPDGFGDRVETLVCNYGPLDRKTPRELYQDGVPDLCPQGTVESPRYGALCRVSSEKLQEWPSRKAHRGSQPAEEEKAVQTMTSGAFPIKRAVYLVQLALLLLARLST